MNPRQKLLLTLVFFFAAWMGADAQYHITYHYTYYSTETGEPLDQVNTDIEWQDYFVMDGFGKSYYDGNGFLMQVYNGHKNEYSQVTFEGKVVNMDASKPYEMKLLAINKLDTSVVLHGYECKAIELVYEKYKMRYYYSTALKVNPDSFSEFKYIDWASVIKAMDGGIALKFGMYFPEYYFEADAYGIEQLQLSKDDFDPDKALAKYMVNQNAKLKSLQKRYKALDMGLNYKKAKTIHAKGFMKLNKMSFPLEFIVRPPSESFIKTDFQKLSYLEGGNKDYTWAYDPIKESVTKEESNDKNGSPLVNDLLVSFETIPEKLKNGHHLISIRDIDGADGKSIKLGLYDSLTGISNFYLTPENLKIKRVCASSGITELSNYQMVDGFLFPMSYVYELFANDKRVEISLNNVSINHKVEDGFFIVPDSLTAYITEKKPIKTAKDYYDEGEKLLAKKEYNKAIASYAEAIKISPNDALIFNQSGLAKLGLEDYYGAISDFNRAVSIQPVFYKALTNMAYTKYMLGDVQSAIKDYNSAIALDSTQSSAFSGRGKSYFYLGQYENALSDYLKASEFDASNASYLFSVGLSYAQLKMYERALDYYQKAEMLGYTNAEYFNYRGIAYYSLEDYEMALKDFKKATSLDKSSATKFSNLGYAYSSLNNRKEAIRSFEKMAALDTTNAEAHNLIGLEYLNDKSFDLAVTEFSKAIKLDNGTATYFDNRAMAKEYLMDFTGAIEDYTSSLNLYAEDAEVYYRRGEAKVNINNHLDACLDFKKAKELGHEGVGEVLEQKCFGGN